MRDSHEDVADENRSYCHRDSSSTLFLVGSLPPCPRLFSRAPKRTQQVRSIDRKRRWRRKRRRDPWHSAVVEGTVDPGGLDVPAPPRVKVGDFAFYSFALASDKRAVNADERAVFRGDICRTQLTAPAVDSSCLLKLRSANTTPRRMGTGRSMAR